jgi:hypothetical protein
MLCVGRSKASKILNHFQYDADGSILKTSAHRIQSIRHALRDGKWGASSRFFDAAGISTYGLLVDLILIEEGQQMSRTVAPQIAEGKLEAEYHAKATMDRIYADRRHD